MTCRAWCMFRMFCATVTTTSATDSGLCGDAKSFPPFIDDGKVWAYVCQVVVELSYVGKDHQPLCPIRWNWSTQRFTLNVGECM